MQRNLVVCCDGTWNTPTQKDRGLVVPSNVVKMSRAIDDSDPTRQRIYYDTGVGTGRGIDKWFGGAFGVGLTDNIQQAYQWVADEYRDGDRLYLFGFSRGAYTVRSLAGLIGRCGLTPVGDAKAARKAYDLYRQASDDRRRALADAFKAGQRDVRVHFLGVWDTVGSLGVPALSRYGLLRKTVRRLARGSKLAHGFHDENLGRHVAHAYHAVAIDEERGPFAPSLWKTEGAPRDNVEQVWFAGVHCNVGGGYVDAGLSDHALLWMAAKAMKAGLALDYRYLAMRVDPNCHGELRDSKTLAYHLIPDHEREIGLPNTLNERIHRSAVSRMRHPTNGYRPRSLTRALDIGVPVTDEGLDLLERIRAALYPEPPDMPKRAA